MDKSTIALGLGLVAILIAIGSFLHQPAEAPPTPGGVSNTDNLQLTNVGTSTLTRVGCYQGYATSTATPITFTYNTSATSTIIGAGAAAGFVTWNFGQCGAAPGL